MLGDPLPYPNRGHRTNIQQLPLNFIPAPPRTVYVDVKALNGAIVYQDYDMALPVPEDQFVPVPLTSAIVQAIHDGDLEQEGKPYMDTGGEEGKEPRGARRTTRHARTHHATESGS